MQVLIVEDEPAAVRHLSRLLGQWDKRIEILADLDSIDSTVLWLQSHRPPELIFMDIQLADGLSFEIFDQVVIDTPIVFCTAYDQYAIQAFKVNSIDYLLKPLELTALGRSIEKFRKLQSNPITQAADLQALMQQLSRPQTNQATRFLVKVGNKYISVTTDQVAYFFIEFKIVTLVTLAGKTHALDHSLDEVDKMIDTTEFFRVSRQALISIHGIKNVENDYGRLNVYLSTGPKKYVTVSRDKATVFKRWLGQ